MLADPKDVANAVQGSAGGSQSKLKRQWEGGLCVVV